MDAIRPSPPPPEGFAAQLAALKPTLELLTMAACVLDADMRYRYANKAYEDYFGLPAGHFLGHTPDEAFKRKPRDSRRCR